MESYKRKNVHHLNDSIGRKRLERCIQLKVGFAPGTEDQILFSDEKLFTVEEASNRQNERTLASRSQDIPDCINKDEWPPSSPDLNPLDYSVWANLESRACAKSHKSLESLKVNLLSEWQKIPQEELRKAVHQFRGRITSVSHKKGGYIE
ncbi:hypothetical protein LOD99_8992 [Oopsacas minuta]|uniref:Uncharacterized protein n=1 Tax=Oopsacas minuta TaxID=111878 RepID=A0AAV7JDV7_9METZ|nr:hypothetical protein LOD99_8992 [Oopsacas minuta]